MRMLLLLSFATTGNRPVSLRPTRRQGHCASLFDARRRGAGTAVLNVLACMYAQHITHGHGHTLAHPNTHTHTHTHSFALKQHRQKEGNIDDAPKRIHA